MRGHMRERKPGQWELIVSIGRDPISGRQRQRSKTVRGSKRDAQRTLAAMVTEADRIPAADGTVGLVIDEWVSHYAEHLSPTTLREYRRLIDRRIRPALGAIPLRKLTTRHLDSFYAALGVEGLSPASVRQMHAIIRRALGQAVKWEWLPANPAVNASPPAQRRRETSPPSPASMLRLIAMADERDPDLGSMLRFAAATGVRRGEICGLRWASLDLARGLSHITETVVDGGGQLIWKDTKTHAARTVPLDVDTVAVLRSHLEWCERRAAIAGETLRPDGYVWSLDFDGTRPWRPERVTGRFRSLCKTAGVQARLHDIRHFHATQLLAAGVDVRTVATRLGHASPTTTLNIYAHAVTAAETAAAGVIGGILTPTPLTSPTK